MMNEYINKAETFLRNCVFDGLAHSFSVNNNEYVKPYPEVTGYVIKYFCDYSEKVPENILEAGKYLVKIQDSATGGFASFERKEVLYVFDTAQIVRGLCALYTKTMDDEFLEAAIKGGNFILQSLELNGALKPTFNKKVNAWVIRDEIYNIWNGPFSGLMCKPAESLLDLFELTRNDIYLDAITQIGGYYSKAKYIEHSHPLGYWLEGLLVTGRESLIDEVIEKKILKRIKGNGYISYTDDLNYAYVSGTIQLGIILYKRGYIDAAKKIREYGRLVQSLHTSGGLYQYADIHGRLVMDVHDEVNSWGTKYFCELEHICSLE